MEDVMTNDPLLAGVINSGKRRKGWMTSADHYDPAKIKEVGARGAALMAALVADYNAARSQAPQQELSA